jgi:hypothetical protein
MFFPKNMYPPIRLHGAVVQKPIVAHEFIFYMRMRQLMNSRVHVMLAYRTTELVHLLFLRRERRHVPNTGLPSFILVVRTDRSYWILCNENQLDELFIYYLFSQSTSTCFGHVYCPSSGGIHCILRMYSSWYVLFVSVDVQLTRPAANQLKCMTCTSCCTYTVNAS